MLNYETLTEFWHFCACIAGGSFEMMSKFGVFPSHAVQGIILLCVLYVYMCVCVCVANNEIISIIYTSNRIYNRDETCQTILLPHINRTEIWTTTHRTCYYCYCFCKSSVCSMFFFVYFGMLRRIDIGLEYIFQRTYLNSANVRDQTWFHIVLISIFSIFLLCRLVFRNILWILREHCTIFS